MTPDLITQIITLSLIVFVPLLLWQRHPTKWAVIGVVMYTASYFISNLWQLAFLPLEPPHAYGFALRLYQAGTLLLVVAYCAIVFHALTSGVQADLQARLVWLVLLIAEGFSVLEYAGCKMLTDPFGSGDYLLSQVWGIETSRFACGRAFSVISPYLAPIVTSLYLLWAIAGGRRQRKE